jgi:trypsin
MPRAWVAAPHARVPDRHFVQPPGANAADSCLHCALAPYRPLTRVYLPLLAALALAFALAPVARAGGGGVSPRIVNGSSAAATDFPFQALLHETDVSPVSSGSDDPGGRFCGGVIVNDTQVVTAAHCVFDVFRAGQVSDPADVEVLVGTDNLTNMTGAEDVVASAISFDPNYDPSTNVHDVAIVTLSTPLTPSSTIAPITILDAATFDSLTASTPFVVSGWGDMSQEPADGSGVPSFGNTLQAAGVPLVDNTTCSTEYGAQGVPVDTNLLFCAGDGTDPNTIADSCQGDSGGPIVYDTDSPNKAYKLVGLVDSGIGCAVQGFPGIYTSVTHSAVNGFLDSDHTPAPSQSTPTTLSGGTSPGQPLTCSAGSWSGSPTFTYQFFKSSGTALTSASPTATYTVQASDISSRIQCEVEATNDGGFGFGESNFVTIPIPTQPPPPPPPAKDSTAPRLRVGSKKCTKTSCTLKVTVTDPGTPSSGVGKVKATLGFTRKVKCRSRGTSAARTCTKHVSRALKVSGGAGGKFTIVASHLTPGKGYTISIVPFDKAGNRPQFSTITSVRTKPRHARGLF